MQHCLEGHELRPGRKTCGYGHSVEIAGLDESIASVEPTDESWEAPFVEPSDVSQEAETEAEHEGGTMGDNISTPTIQGFGGFGSWGHWKDRDGLEGKDAVMIHALHDGRDHKDTLRGVLDSKFDVVSALDCKIERLRDRLDDKFDKLDCKVERKFERVDDKLEEFERRQVARVIKEQDDKIQELKLKLLLCEKLPVPAPAPVPAP